MTILPGLDGPLATALQGEMDPDRLFVTIEPNERFYFALPYLDEEHGEVLGGSSSRALPPPGPHSTLSSSRLASFRASGSSSSAVRFRRMNNPQAASNTPATRPTDAAYGS